MGGESAVPEGYREKLERLIAERACLIEVAAGLRAKLVTATEALETAGIAVAA